MPCGEQSIGKLQFFLKFFERRDKFTFLIEKEVQRKNKVTRDLPSSIMQKFSGHEIIKHELARKEKIEFTPINTIYEPIYDENVPVPCYFIDIIHLACRSYIGRYDKEKEQIKHLTVRKCPYSEKNFWQKTRKTWNITPKFVLLERVLPIALTMET